MITNPLKKTVLLGIISSTMALMLSGCASTEVIRVDPNGPRTLDSIHKLNMQDWNEAADDLITKMQNEFIGQAKFQSSRGPGEKSVLAISRFVNDTGEQINEDLLVKRIRVALNQTGKFDTDVTSGLGVVEDPLADAWKRQYTFEHGGNLPAPDYSLTIKIIHDKTHTGNTTEVTYSFQLSLATMDGLAVWEGEHLIVKQKNGRVVGF